MRRPVAALSRNHYFVIGLLLGLMLSCYIPEDVWKLVQQEECPQEAAENLLIERFGQDFEPHLNLINKPLEAKKPYIQQMLKFSVYPDSNQKSPEGMAASLYFRTIGRHMCMLVRQNFAKSCEKKLNDQINMELKACHQYLAMAYHFDRSDISSPGLHGFFLQASVEEREHAEKIMKYMNKRGGLIMLDSVPKPLPCFASSLEALKHALRMELEVNQHLLDLHTLAGKEADPNLCDFIEANFLQEQVDGQKVLADYIRQLERAQSDVGEYLFDKYLSSAGMHAK